MNLPLAHRAAAAAGVLVIALALASCGGSSSSSATNANAGADRPATGSRGFLGDPKVVACLKKEGVTVPAGRRRGNGGPPNGQAPNGQNGQPPNGQPPNGQPRNGQNAAQVQKLRKALQKCGVNFPGGPPGGQAPQDQGTTTSAS